MAKQVKFELNYQGVGELLKSAEMQKVLQEYANARLPKGGYFAKVFVGRKRAAARLSAGTPEAARDNLKHNTLLKALGGGGS